VLGESVKVLLGCEKKSQVKMKEVGDDGWWRLRFRLSSSQVSAPFILGIFDSEPQDVKDRHLEMLRRSQAKCHLRTVKLILGCCKTSGGYHIEEV
jgi:hypothetical protein